MCGPRKLWSASTPIPQRCFCLAALSPPSPQAPAASNSTREPLPIWLSVVSFELRVRKRGSHVVERAELEEDTDRDDEAVAVLRGGLEVRLPVRRRLGDVDAAIDLQLLDRPLQAHVGQMVEALVVEAADV